MKLIYVMETKWDIENLYASATTKAQRSLLGYMIKTGRSDDLIFGGAFAMLRDVENCATLYRLTINTNHYKDIIKIAQEAKQGTFRRFAFSKREIRHILRICERMQKTGTRT